jgi:hypothetical protein
MVSSLKENLIWIEEAFEVLDIGTFFCFLGTAAAAGYNGGLEETGYSFFDELDMW